MIKKAELHAMYGTMGKEAYIAMIREMKGWHEKLLSRYAEHYDTGATPAETVSRLIDDIGPGPAAMVLATMINSTGEWDGRISRTARQWAAGIPDALDNDAAYDMGLNPDRIHPAHRDQLAMAARKQLTL